MKKLFADLKKCRDIRKEYRIKPYFSFENDRTHYVFSLIPTIVFIPWVYMYPKKIGMVEVWWLHYHIYFGKLERKDEDE